MISRRQLLRLPAAAMLAASLLAVGILSHAAQAQTQTQAWPNRHVRLIVPFPPGGGADTIARLIAARLSDVWGQQV